MKEKKYADSKSYNEDLNFTIYGYENTTCWATKQMLIGYMIEYILEKKLSLKLLFISSDSKKTTIERYYNYLKNYIDEKLNKQ